MSLAESACPLSSSVLVLNRQYLAVHVINVRRAFTLLVRDLAEVIHVEDGQYANYDFASWREVSEMRSEFREPHDDWLRAVNFEVQVPRVIRLLFYDRVPNQSVRFNRRRMARPGSGLAAAARSSSPARKETSASCVPLSGRGIPCGGIDPVPSLRTTFSSGSAFAATCAKSMPSRARLPVFVRSL